MYSWTINGAEYLAPQSTEEITVKQFQGWIDLQPRPEPRPFYKAGKKRGVLAGISRTLNRKSRDRRKSVFEDANLIVDRARHDQMFVQHWLGIPEDTVLNMEPDDITAIRNFVESSWEPFEQVDPDCFVHDGRVWMVDYTLETLGSLGPEPKLAQVLAATCSSILEYRGTEYWDAAPASIAVAVMQEVRKRSHVYSTIMGGHILQAFDIKP